MLKTHHIHKAHMDAYCSRYSGENAAAVILYYTLAGIICKARAGRGKGGGSWPPYAHGAQEHMLQQVQELAADKWQTFACRTMVW